MSRIHKEQVTVPFLSSFDGRFKLFLYPLLLLFIVGFSLASGETITLLPSYSPELNPAEHIWDYIREQKKFNNYIFDSLDALDDHLFEVLRNLNDEKQYISSLCTFNWMLNSS